MDELHHEQTGSDAATEAFVNSLVNEDGSLNEEAAFEHELDAELTEVAGRGPARGPDGRFISREHEDSLLSGEDDLSDDGVSDEELLEDDLSEEDFSEDDEDWADEDYEEDEDGYDPEMDIDPPASMAARYRESFHTLPTEQKQFLVDIEKAWRADLTRKQQELAEQRKAVEPLERVLAPHRHKIAHMGARPEQVIDQLLTLADHADRDFAGFVREQARLRGVPLEALAQQQDGEEDRQVVDPRLNAALQRVGQLEQYLNQDIQQRQAITLQNTADVVDAFSESGEFPFFAELEEDMVPIAAMLRQMNPNEHPHHILEKAYRAALSMNEEVAARAEADRRAREEPARRRRARAEAARARRSAYGNITGNGTLPEGDGVSAADLSKVPDFIAQTYDRLQRP